MRIFKNYLLKETFFSYRIGKKLIHIPMNHNFFQTQHTSNAYIFSVIKLISLVNMHRLQCFLLRKKEKKESLDKKQIPLVFLFAKAWLRKQQYTLNPSIHDVGMLEKCFNSPLGLCAHGRKNSLFLQSFLFFWWHSCTHKCIRIK